MALLTFTTLKSFAGTPKTLVRSISSKLIRGDIQKLKPFPYREKKYTFLRSLFDRTTHRFDENSKVIVVEGPIQSGKTAFAKELARQLDMHHIPDANMDMLYINQYGYDMRQLDNRLPESTRSFDEKNFCRDPKHTNAAAFQIWMYRLRFSLYIDALTHVLNTGQGVVIQRCPWSDSVFMDAMASQRYVSEGALGAYNQIVKHTLSVLMKPHLVIYLDVPADRVLENIKKKGEPFEKEGKALTKGYLHDLENNWKNKFLKEVSINSELVMYDWSNGGDVEAVVEDLERIDFDRFTKHDAKLQDWRKWREQEWSDTRIMYTNNKASLMSLFNIPIYDVPELLVNGEDLKEFNDVWYSAPGMEYDPGFNSARGDKTLFKTSPSHYVPY